MYIIVPNEGELMPATYLLNAAKVGANPALKSTFNSLNLTLKPSDVSAHWIAQLDVNEKIWKYNLTFPPDNITYGMDRTLKYVELLAFVDRVFPAYISKYVQGGYVFAKNF